MAKTMQENESGLAVAKPEPKRAAYSLAEFARMFGKTATWAHRLHYAGKLRVIEGLGHKLVSQSEVDRLLGA